VWSNSLQRLEIPTTGSRIVLFFEQAIVLCPNRS
jgi:hypothetical protein